MPARAPVEVGGKEFSVFNYEHANAFLCNRLLQDRWLVHAVCIRLDLASTLFIVERFYLVCGGVNGFLLTSLTLRLCLLFWRCLLVC
jgi:hypothetical protein